MSTLRKFTAVAAFGLALATGCAATAQTPATPSPKEVLFLSAAQLAKDEARTLGMAATYSYQKDKIRVNFMPVRSVTKEVRRMFPR